MRFSKILYVVLLYVNIVILLYPYPEHWLGLPYLPDWLTSGPTFVLWLLMLVLMAVLVIAGSVRSVIRGDARRLLGGMSWFKASLVPFFVLNFLFVALIISILGLYGMGFVLNGHAVGHEGEMVASGLLAAAASAFGGGVAALAFAITYAVFLPTSAEGIALLVVLRRRREIGIPAFVLHLVLQLLFLADLVSTVILLVTYWKKVVSGRDSAPVGAVEATA